MQNESTRGQTRLGQPRRRWNSIPEDASLPRSLDDVVFIKRTDLSIGSRIGSGSFGTVYCSRFQDKKVAFKVLHVKNSLSRIGYLAGSEESQTPKNESKEKVADLVTALEKEVKVLKCLSSCAEIVRFFGVCLEPAGIVTEYCENESLFDFIESARQDKTFAEKLTWEKRLSIALDVARGMDFLHSRESVPVLHRDLKSPNLLLDENLNCKICDFNLAGFLDSKVMTNSLAANNPTWLAPEILKGKAFTKASDVYPFGIILWELLTWTVPYTAEGEPFHHAAVVYLTVFKNERPTIPPDEELIGGPCPVYSQYCDLMQRCWNGNPKERPSYPEIVCAIEELIRTVKNEASASQLKRCDCFGSDIEKQIEDSPDLAARLSGEAIVETDVITRHSPFAVARTSRLIYNKGVRPLMGVFRASRQSKRSSQDSRSSIDEKNALVESKRTAARRHWDKIGNVVRLIIERRRNYRIYRMLNQSCSLSGENSESEAYPSMAISIPTQHALEIIGDDRLDEANSHSGSSPAEKKWRVVRDVFCSNVDRMPQRWNLLLDHVHRRASLSSGGTSSLSLNGRGGDSGKARGFELWDLVRSNFLEKSLDGYPRTPPAWYEMLEILCPADVNEMARAQSSCITTRLSSCSSTKRNSSGEVNNDLREWLNKDDPLVQRHKQLLSAMSKSRQRQAPGDGAHEISPPNKTLVVNQRIPSEEQRTLVRNFLLNAQLPPEWNELVQFVGSMPELSDQGWRELKALSLETPSIHSHNLWDFFRQLLQ